MHILSRWFGCGAVCLILMPSLAMAQFEDPEPAAEAPCKLGVAATERRNNYTVTQIESNSPNVKYYECQLALADYSITISETITLRDLPGRADYYEVLVTVLLAEDEASDATKLYFYTEEAFSYSDAAELAAGVTPGLTAVPSANQGADEAEDLLPLYRQIVVLLMELLRLLEARAS